MENWEDFNRENKDKDNKNFIKKVKESWRDGLKGKGMSLMISLIFYF